MRHRIADNDGAIMNISSMENVFLQNLKEAAEVSMATKMQHCL